MVIIIFIIITMMVMHQVHKMEIYLIIKLIIISLTLKYLNANFKYLHLVKTFIQFHPYQGLAYNKEILKIWLLNKR